MNDNVLVYIVDDDPGATRLLEKILAERYRVATFHSAEECRQAFAAEAPGIFLLDVGLPGIDGYELCRLIKSEPRGLNVPVLFISGRVDTDSRLRAYECGGEDFISKPYDVREIEKKIERTLADVSSRVALSGQLADAETLTGLILSNLDEYAILVKYLRALNDVQDSDTLMTLTHSLLRGYQLSGVVQLRIGEVEHTRDVEGHCTPVMLSIMQNMRTMERIFEFRSHGVYNFAHITVIVDNMPLDDPERCGRLRDHLAIAFETADSRARSLLIAGANQRSTAELQQAVALLRRAIDTQAERYQHAAEIGANVMRELDYELRSAISHLAMTELQEESILELVRKKARDLVAAYDTDGATTQLLSSLNQRLTTTTDALSRLH